MDDEEDEVSKRSIAFSRISFTQEYVVKNRIIIIITIIYNFYRARAAAETGGVFVCFFFQSRLFYFKIIKQITPPSAKESFASYVRAYRA